MQRGLEGVDLGFPRSKVRRDGSLRLSGSG
jgi:hypothetical protein